MNAEEWQDHPETNENGRLVSAAEAARLLDVSESTIWRWIRAGILPAYRIGPKRVRLRVTDVFATMAPLSLKEMPGTTREPGNSARTRELSEAESAELLEAAEAARAFQQALLGKRGGVLFESSVELIHEARRQRTEERS